MTAASGTTPVVTSASYLPSGPLATLNFGTSAVETRTFGPPISDEKPKPTPTIGPGR